MDNHQWKIGFTLREIETEIAKKRQGLSPFKEGIKSKVGHVIQTPNTLSMFPGIRISAVSSKKK